MIKIFDSLATSFTSNGLGVLHDAISCEVTEERNGAFELVMTYPITGAHYSDLTGRNIIFAKPNPFDDPQAFRIYAISKPFNGIITINAEHISYDMNGIICPPFQSGTLAETIGYLNAISNSPFTFTTLREVNTGMAVLIPTSLRPIVGGEENSMLDIYGGEFKFDNYTTTIYNNRGSDRGVTIRYGKNMTDITQDEDFTNVWTDVYPIWYESDDGAVKNYVELPEKTIPVFEDHPLYSRVLMLDLSTELDSQPTEDGLRQAAENYISTHDLQNPITSLSVSFEDLVKNHEYDMLRLLHQVNLCDTVHVIHPKLGVNVSMKCIKTTYNVLTNEYIELELGEPKSNLADTIANQNNVLDRNIPGTASAIDSKLEQAIRNATERITGNRGGYVVMHSSTGSSYPDEILILDAQSGGRIEDAQDIWRWNNEGLGYSSTGYDGPYGTAITSDGKIVADYILAGEMDGQYIKANTVEAQALVFKDNGSNLVQNSSGLNELADPDPNWAITAGTVVTTVKDSETKLRTSSGGMFQIQNGLMTQIIPINPGKKYSLVMKSAIKDQGVASATLSDGISADPVIIFSRSGTGGWYEDSVEITTDENASELTLNILCSAGILNVADIMLVQGERPQNWSPAAGELYSETVRIDRNGIKVFSGKDVYTKIDSEQFGIYGFGAGGDDEQLLSVNATETMLQRTYVKERLSLGDSIKIVPIDGGIEIVSTD